MSKQRICLLWILTFLLLTAPITAHAAEPIYLASQAAVVIDYETGAVLFNQNMDTLLVPASLTKIMTAYILYEEIVAGNLTKDSLIPITPHAQHISTEIDHRAPFSEDAAYTVDTLLKLIFLPSSNAGSIAVAEHISGSQEAFAQRMNETADRLGMDAQYETAHGLWGDNLKTAYCVAILTRNLIQNHPDVLAYSSLESVRFYDTEYFNINRLIFDYEEIDGFKTGATAAAGYCLVTTALRDGRRIIVVTMNAPSRDAAFADSLTLLDYGFAALENRDVAVEAEAPDVTPPYDPAEAREEAVRPYIGILVGALVVICIVAGVFKISLRKGRNR